MVLDSGFQFPASFAQRRLWFLDRLEPDTGLYNIALAWQIRGDLDRRALERSLNEVVRRHESLRTCFAVDNDVPVQIIAKTLCVSVEFVDLSLAMDAHPQALQRIRQEAGCPFDLGCGPLIRAGLIRLGEGDHILLLTLHHIVSDGWSTGVLLHEWATVYGAFIGGLPSPLEELGIQYADFAVWQREWLQGKVLQEQLDYWRGALQGAPAVLELPTDRARPGVLTHHGAFVNFDLGADLGAKLRDLSRRCEVTLFMTLAAAFNVLLHRYSHQHDICIGYPVANRQRTEIEGLIGFFVNTVVLRTRLQPEQSFQSLLRQTREWVLDADKHQDLPFETLVQELQPDRSLNRSPIFQVMFALNDAGHSELDFVGLEARSLPCDTGLAKFELTLSIAERDGELAATFEYNTDLYDRDTIERMAGHYRTLLEAVIADPAAPIARLPMLTPAEQRRLLVEWNDTTGEFPADRCLHALLEDQAASSPDAVAVVFEHRQLTYGELDRRANQLAHHLRTLGVGPDTLVALCVHRSLDMIVALLGILKAGGAYVPLDPEYPQERLAYMLEDSGAPVLVTQTYLRELSASGAATVCLDGDGAAIARQPDATPPHLTHPQNLAYCIYTSGSTGKPKGVLINHRSVVNLVHWHCRRFGLSSRDRTTQFSNIAFDAASWEIWGSLACGATMYLIGARTISSTREITEFLHENAISLAFLPTPAFESMSSLSPLRLPSLRWLLTGGDQLKQCPAFADPIVVNNYGPTEATVVATSGRVSARGAGDAARPPPIGRPIANTRIYILDAQQNLVPVGVIGELHIGGVGVARGYHRRADLTAERFVPDPFGPPGSRMFRSGDLTRYLPDGNIQFVGRSDHQVKIRGFRIELGEIESALLRCDGVREAVVAVLDDADAGKRLVAYIVAREAQALEATQLRTYLRRSLPEYMVPAAFVFLRALPLNANGKIDRPALPQPDCQSAQGSEYLAPRNATEEMLADAWAQVLKLDRVSMHANFFELGGHSLLAVSLIGRLNSALNLELSPKVLFAHQTVADLAQHIDRHDSRELQPSGLLTTLSREPALQTLYCVPGAGMFSVAFWPLAKALKGTAGVCAFEPMGLDEPIDALHVRDIAARYVGHLPMSSTRDPIVLVGHSFGGSVAFEMAILLERMGREARLLLLDSGVVRLLPPSATGDVAILAERASPEMGLAFVRRHGNMASVGPVREFSSAVGDRSSDETGEARRAQEAKWLDSIRRLIARQVSSLERYVPSGRFNGRVAFFLAKDGELDQGSITRELLQKRSLLFQQPRFHAVPGDHFSMLDVANASFLADAFRSEMLFERS